MKTRLTIVMLMAALLVPTTAWGAKRKQKASKAQPQVIYTGDIADKVMGYNGPTPLNIIIQDGEITDIEVLENTETPQYFKRATAKVIPQYLGKTVAEAKALEPDGATGATYSSKALIENIRKGLDKAQTAPAKKKGKSKSNTKR